MSKRKRVSWLAIVLPAAMGLPLLVIGMVALVRAGRDVVRSERVEGIVVENSLLDIEGGVSVYAPRVEFDAEDGSIISFTDEVVTPSPEFEIGTTVTVLYDPEDAEAARVYTWRRLWLFPLAITTAGLAPSLIAAVVILLLRQLPPRPSKRAEAR